MKKNIFPKGVVFSEYANIPVPFKIFDYMKPLFKFGGKIEMKSVGMGHNNFWNYYLLEKELERKGGSKIEFFETKVIKVKKEKKTKRTLVKKVITIEVEGRNEADLVWFKGIIITQLKSYTDAYDYIKVNIKEEK